ncbi:flavodoxin [Telmatospirillum siberiense]|uniref:Flavodoxin n=1 Tax=Telmatospirillum siberiense TaxID=382514 RepID=A0A2N3PWT4_9PROT|nr:flavodoxin [Telmatospirillum siberiense]PKU24873.1 flavodoxin [Telmatospirillum siberiense]
MKKAILNTLRGPSRRKLLQVTAAGVLAGVATSNLPGRSSAFAAEKRTGKTLVAYFSRTGNTRDVANQIHQSIGGDIVEILTTHSYPSDYRATTEQAKREQESNFRPQLTTEIQNIDAYDIVFVGYPNWWSTLPMAFFSFFEKYNFDNNMLIPFCTHEGSYLGRSVSDMKALCPNSTIREGLALRGGNSGYAKTDAAHREIAEWLHKLKIAA